MSYAKVVGAKYPQYRCDATGATPAAKISYVPLAEIKSALCNTGSSTDDASSIATNDIVLPRATRHAVEQGVKRRISLTMLSAKSTYKYGRRKETSNQWGEKTIKIFPPRDQPHGHILWMKNGIITSQALQRKG